VRAPAVPRIESDEEERARQTQGEGGGALPTERASAAQPSGPPAEPQATSPLCEARTSSAALVPCPGAWGVWEAVATAATFSVPAALFGFATHAERPGLDGFDWALAGGACVAALALTIAAKGLGGAREFLSVGLLTSCAWLVGSRFIADRELAFTYAAFAVGIIVAELHLFPVALFAAWRSLQARLGRQRSRRALARIAGAAACVAALDLSPAGLALAPETSRGAAALAVLAACAVGAGLLAALASRELSAAAVTPGEGAR